MRIFNQQFESIDASSSIKETFLKRKNIPVVEEEDSNNIEVKMEYLAYGECKVVFVHDGLLDGSVKGIRLIFFMNKNNGYWVASKIRKSIKCYKNRGNEEWGTIPCK